MDINIVPPDEVIGKCAWCGKHIPDDAPVYGLGGKAREGVDLSEYEGRAIEITIAAQNKQVPMMVTELDSEAKRDGKDFMFVMCSEDCAWKMTATWKDLPVLLRKHFQARGLQTPGRVITTGFHRTQTLRSSCGTRRDFSKRAS